MINKMHEWKHLLFAAACWVAASPGDATDAPKKLEVILSQPPSKQEADAGFITVDITNKSDQTLFLPRPATPLENPDGHLLNLIFQVRNAAGENAEFIGRFVNFRPDSIEDFYTRIDPGQHLKKTINLSADYDLSKGGHFTVTYEQPYADEVYMLDGEAMDDSTTDAKSNELDIWVSTSLATAARKISYNTQDNPH